MSRHARLLVVLVALLALLTGAGVAYATIPDSNGTIHTCYRADGIGQGTLSVIDSDTESCPSGFEELTWSQGGLVGRTTVSNTVSSSNPAVQSVTADVACPAGTVATGGGAATDVLVASKPTATGWEATGRRFDPGGGGSIGVTVWAVCAEVSP